MLRIELRLLLIALALICLNAKSQDISKSKAIRILKQDSSFFFLKVLSTRLYSDTIKKTKFWIIVERDPELIARAKQTMKRIAEEPNPMFITGGCHYAREYYVHVKTGKSNYDRSILISKYSRRKRCMKFQF